MTFEDCLDQVAKNQGYSDWQNMTIRLHYTGAIIPPIIYQKASDLFATEAIKADRQRISQLCLSKASIHEGVSFSCPFDVEMIHSLPIQL